jgi:SAM-dependent methyltransferase
LLMKKEQALVEGSDISLSLVKKIQSIRPDFHYRYVNIENKQSRTNTYDIVFAFEVLEHVNNPTLALNNIRKLLVPDGWFIGSTPYPYAKNMKDPTHINVKYPRNWHNLLKQSGYRNIRLLPASFFPFLWRIHPGLNVVLPFYTPVNGFISTTLILAQK